MAERTSSNQYFVRVSDEERELIEDEAAREEIRPTTILRAAAIRDLKRRREQREQQTQTA